MVKSRKIVKLKENGYLKVKLFFCLYSVLEMKVYERISNRLCQIYILINLTSFMFCFIFLFILSAPLSWYQSEKSLDTSWIFMWLKWFVFARIPLVDRAGYGQKSQQSHKSHLICLWGLRNTLHIATLFTYIFSCLFACKKKKEFLSLMIIYILL